MTEDEVIALISRHRNGKTIRAYAAEIGVSAAYLSDILARKREPGQKCLDHFGISKRRREIVEYVGVEA